MNVEDNIPIVQVAFSVRDRHSARRWYEQVLGYLDSGGMEIQPPGPGEVSAVERLQGVPGADTDVCWAVDQQELFQLEWFQYRQPVPPEPTQPRRLCDVGYRMVSFHVPDFDAAIERAASCGTPALTDAVGRAGDRRVCVRDRDGILIELMECDPRTPTPSSRPRSASGTAVARSITASVRDLDRSLSFFVDTLGMIPAPDVRLHVPDHGVLWGLEGARREEQILWAGDFWLELVCYREPVGKPWPREYLLSDFGIMNIALGPRTLAEYRTLLGRVRKRGYTANVESLLPGVATNYTLDDQGFSVELVYAEQTMRGALGFLPVTADTQA